MDRTLDASKEVGHGQTHYLAVLDNKTGEIVSYKRLGARSGGLGGGFVALYQDAAMWIGAQDITGEQAKVLFCIMGKLDYDNYVTLPRQGLADDTGLRPEAVSRAMRRLKELGIILEGPRAGKYKTYRFNPRIAHKGKNLKKTISEYDTMAKVVQIEEARKHHDEKS